MAAANAMSDASKPFIPHFGAVDTTQSGRVIVMTTLLERTLESALKAKMRKLNSDLSSKLFSGHGPLSTLSSKIDLCYALEIVDKPTMTKLHQIREIRNLFAHSEELIGFGHRNFQNSKKVASNPLRHSEDHFADAIAECFSSLWPHIQTKSET